MIKAIQRRKSLCRLIVSSKEIRLHHGEESWVQVAGQVARIIREVTFQLQAGSLQERRDQKKGEPIYSECQPQVANTSFRFKRLHLLNLP